MTSQEVGGENSTCYTKSHDKGTSDIIWYEDFVLNLGTVKYKQSGRSAALQKQPHRLCVFVSCPQSGSIDCDVAGWDSGARRFGNGVTFFKGSQSVMKGIFNIWRQKRHVPSKCLEQLADMRCHLTWRSYGADTHPKWTSVRAHSRTVNSTAVLRNCNTGLYKTTPTKYIILLNICN